MYTCTTVQVQLKYMHVPDLCRTNVLHTSVCTHGTSGEYSVTSPQQERHLTLRSNITTDFLNNLNHNCCPTSPLHSTKCGYSCPNRTKRRTMVKRKKSDQSTATVRSITKTHKNEKARTKAQRYDLKLPFVIQCTT